jgi:hypothetical protein
MTDEPDCERCDESRWRSSRAGLGVRRARHTAGMSAPRTTFPMLSMPCSRKTHADDASARGVEIPLINLAAGAAFLPVRACLSVYADTLERPSPEKMKINAAYVEANTLIGGEQLRSGCQARAFARCPFGQAATSRAARSMQLASCLVRTRASGASNRIGPWHIRRSWDILKKMKTIRRADVRSQIRPQPQRASGTLCRSIFVGRR